MGGVREGREGREEGADGWVVVSVRGVLVRCGVRGWVDGEGEG